MAEERVPAEEVPVTATLADAVNRLTDAGYTDDFRCEAGGLRAVKAGCVHQPEEMIADDIFRFEGTTDPADEAIVFGLHCRPHGVRGTYVTSYGATMTPLDADMVRRLSRGSA